MKKPRLSVLISFIQNFRVHAALILLLLTTASGAKESQGTEKNSVSTDQLWKAYEFLTDLDQGCWYARTNYPQYLKKLRNVRMEFDKRYSIVSYKISSTLLRRKQGSQHPYIRMNKYKDRMKQKYLSKKRDPNWIKTYIRRLKRASQGKLDKSILLTLNHFLKLSKKKSSVWPGCGFN